MREQFISRWGDPELDDKQYLTIPGWILRNYHKFVDLQTGEIVGLTAQEFAVMSHIMAFHFDSERGGARPSLNTVAEYMGVSLNTVRRSKNSLELKGALRVEYHKGKPSSYSFAELSRQCRKLERERLAVLEAETPHESEGGIKQPPTNLGGVLPPNLVDEDKESKREKKDSAPVGAGTNDDDGKASQGKQLARALFTAVAKHIYAIDGEDVNGAGGRIGKISNWLAGKYAGRGENKVGKISHPASPEHVARFAAWYKNEHPGVSTPRDFVKFVESWREWATAQRTPKPQRVAYTQEELDEMSREMMREKFGIDQ